MRIKNYLYRLTGAISLFVLVSCVNDSFDLDNVSKEVTLGSGTTIVPLGYIENKTLETMLGNAGIEGLQTDENGNLSYKFSGSGDTLHFESMSTEFEIPEIAVSFDVEYPQFDLESEQIVIDEQGDMNVDLSKLDRLKEAIHEQTGVVIPENEYFIPEELPEGVEIPEVSGHFGEVFDEDDWHLELDLPEQIENVSKVYFRDIDSGHHGAPMHLTVDFKDLAAINGGGTLRFDLKVDGGTLNILNSNDELTAVHDDAHYFEEYRIESGVESFDFAIYVESLINDIPIDINHHLDIPLELTFDVQFTLDTKPGHFELNTMPHIELFADFEYGDADVIVDSSKELVESHVTMAEPIEVSGMPAEVKRIYSVNMKQDENASLCLFTHGLGWLEEYADDIEVVVALPEYLTLHALDHSGCDYNPESRVLTATAAAMEEGVELAIESLDFGTEGKAPVDGALSLNFEADVKAHFRESVDLKVSSLSHEKDLTIEVGIESTELTMESVCGNIDYSYNVEQKFELGGLNTMGMDIKGLGIKPVIEVNITHPLTMTAKLSGKITPSADGVVNEKGAISFEGIDIKPATYANGDIQPADMILVIADESLREEYSGAQYTFVSCNVSDLLLGTMPDTLDIELSIDVDEEQTQTLYLADSMVIDYGYNVDVPIAVDDSLEVYYEGQVSGLNSTFDMVSGYDFSVGDVTIIATIVNTTPLEFDAEITLKDVDGELTEAQVFVGEDDRVLGSVDGVTPQESVVRLSLDLGSSGHISKLALVDAIQVDLAALSAAKDGSVALNNSQYVGIKLQLELSGGLTIDIEKLLNDSDSEEM